MHRFDSDHHWLKVIQIEQRFRDVQSSAQGRRRTQVGSDRIECYVQQAHLRLTVTRVLIIFNGCTFFDDSKVGVTYKKSETNKDSWDFLKHLSVLTV